MLDVVLRSGRERSVRRRHPWILSGAIERAEGECVPGAWARVLSHAGETLGYGDFSPQSAIRVRLLAFGKELPSDDWLFQQVGRAVARRTADPLLSDTDGLRLVNAEGDDLPGLVADSYADQIVVKLTSPGMAARRVAVAAALRQATGAAAGFERADAVAARREGFPARQAPLWGETPGEPLWIRERGRRYAVDVVHGQKTGFYLDQRDARDLVERLARGRRVLDLFAYTGGFAVAAARGGARGVTGVESSAEALALARRNFEANAPGAAAEWIQADAFQYARQAAGAPGEGYDLIVVDPPPLARSRRDVDRAARAYKDVLLHALRACRPDALLLTFACSHHVGPELFRKIAFAASLDAGRSVQVLRQLGAAADHPVSIDHPEGAYLTGLLLRA